MKSSAISNALRVLVSARQPAFLWGGPGIGKSAVIRQLAAALSMPLRDVRALLLDPVDLRGLPFLGNDGRSKWATPEFLPQDGSGILFLDELNVAPAMVQASCYQLVLDRKLGDYLAGRLGDYRGGQSRFGPRGYHSNADSLAEPLRAPGIRSGYAGMVGVGDSGRSPPGGHCLPSFPLRVTECLRP